MESEKKNQKVIAFGEVLLRLSPPGCQTIRSAESFDIHIGGAELNVCCALSCIGLRSSILTTLPDNSLGRRALAFIESAGVDTSKIRMRKNARMGLYFLEIGLSPRPSRVTYDRKESCFAQEDFEEINWAYELEGFSHFHTTGITPALSVSAISAIKEAACQFREKGISSSVDVNYRSQLWSVESAKQVLHELTRIFEHLIVPRFELERIFGLSKDTPEKSALELLKRFNLCSVAVTSREEVSPGIMKWSAFALDSSGSYPRVERTAIVADPIGAGDAFCAGYIKGITERDIALGLKLGCAMAALKMTLKGDVLLYEAEEIERISDHEDGSFLIR